MKRVCYQRNATKTDNCSSERLLSVANELFCRDGIHATGIKKVLDESGVARRTLYKHFNSKENLVRAVLERESILWLDWFRDYINNNAVSPRDRLLCIFDALKEWFEDESFFGCAFINAVMENHKQDESIQELALQHRENTNNFIRELALAAGVMDPRLITEQLGILVDGAIVGAVTLQSSEPAMHAKMAAKVLVDTAIEQS
ncbi:MULTISPECIES: TetR/AcrR family transcriptional regulator [Thiomicrorhabdus]|uniref:TetR/AcrR family transcriptional regulator n=1 Tax=Thiomicrorhabdus heinhorstiae TaxID=2748010 RepID=A0ABS0BVL9_9GAMM|nr:MULTISPECIES: TetR/AcrR family transcriptional regulator [Thiomicrorhabdus]MBF6057870.1 TetR/AcrR family transcriptional regulator [Thiomicrorhabdus heinhorstiae]